MPPQDADEISIQDFMAQQHQVEEEARLAMPWDPKFCTYEMGSIRQQLYACRTHNNIGICYSCSIRCHTTCDIVELFTKRGFTCDCGTENDTLEADDQGYYCQLRQNRERDIPSTENNYGQNFKGLFCTCSSEYDPDASAVMIQCALGTACQEDWYHDYCIMNIQESDSKSLARDLDEETGESLLHGFPRLDSFDAFICTKCVHRDISMFDRLVSHELSDSFIAHRFIDSSASEAYRKINENGKRQSDESEDSYSLFLKHGYSEILKNIKANLKSDDKLHRFITDLEPTLINPEPVFVIPEDGSKFENDINHNIAHALERSLSHTGAVDSIRAYNEMRYKLRDFLRQFADSGKIVKEENIKEFFNRPRQ